MRTAEWSDQLTSFDAFQSLCGGESMEHVLLRFNYLFCHEKLSMITTDHHKINKKSLKPAGDSRHVIWELYMHSCHINSQPSSQLCHLIVVFTYNISHIIALNWLSSGIQFRLCWFGISMKNIFLLSFSCRSNVGCRLGNEMLDTKCEGSEISVNLRLFNGNSIKHL